MDLRVPGHWNIPPWLATGLLVSVGAILFWPALSTQLFLDDHLQSAMVHGRYVGVRGPFALYDFVADDNRQALFDRGALPWWTDPRLTVRFLRPISSALLYVDHRWLERWPLAMHLHSFAWWIAAVFAARTLFRRLVSPRAAVFATVIFAIAPCHALPIGWLANREALVALTFGTVGLSASLEWRESGGFAPWAIALVAFTLALLAGEYAFGFGGYVAALVCAAPRGTPRRWRAGLLFLVPAAGYLAAHVLLGYGAAGSGFYDDPLRDPWLFVSHLPWRLAFLVLSGCFSQDVGTWQWSKAEWPVVGVTGLFVIGAGIAIVHVAGQLSKEARRSLWALIGGALLSLLPVLAVLQSVRLLGVATLGIAAGVGVLLDAAWFARDTEARRGKDEWTAIVATLLGFAHLVQAPVRGWINARQTQMYAKLFADHAADLAKRIEERPGSPRPPEIVVVRGLDDVIYYAFALDALGVHDAHWTLLSHALHVLAVRDDVSTLDLVAGADAHLFPAPVGGLYRNEASREKVGDTLRLGALTVTIVETDGKGPRRARFALTADLDDARWMWVAESRKRGFYDAPPPKVGFGTPFDQ